jgi:hypothetical protein
VKLARGGCEQHVVGNAEVTACGERLPEGGKRKRGPAAQLGHIGSRPHREQSVARPRVGPAQRREPAFGGTPLDFRDPGGALLPLSPRAPAEALEQPAEQNRLPDRRLREQLVNTLGGKVGVRRAEIEKEFRFLGYGVSRCSECLVAFGDNLKSCEPPAPAPAATESLVVRNIWSPSATT